MLGQRCAERARLRPGPDHWRTRVSALEAVLTERDARIEELQGQRAILETDLAKARARVAELEALLAQRDAHTQELQGQGAALQAKIRSQLHTLYGRRTERSVVPRDGVRQRGQQRGAPGHGRHEQGQLPVEYVDHHRREADACCATCGLPCEPFPGVETSEEIDWVVKVVRVVHRRHRYRATCQCSGTPRLLTAPTPAKLIPKGRYSTRFIAQVIVQKYLWARPLYRITADLALAGAHIPDGSLTEVLHVVAELLRPLYEAICARNRLSPWLHVDETTWRNLWVVPTARGWLWIFVGPDTTVYWLSDSRGHEVLLDYLKLRKADPAFTHVLTIICDFMAAYDATLRDPDCQGGAAHLARCWSHYRRLLQEAARAHPEDAALGAWTTRWLQMIDDFFRYRAERVAAAPDSPAAHDADLALRGCAQEMETVRSAELSQGDLPPKARHLLELADKHWAELTRCIDDPAIPPDNNSAERAARNPVLCRKNFYGSRAPWAGEAATFFWSILATARQNGLNPLTFLIALFGAIAETRGLGPEVLQRFLPWNLDPVDHGRYCQPPKEDPG